MAQEEVEGKVIPPFDEFLDDEDEDEGSEYLDQVEEVFKNSFNHFCFRNSDYADVGGVSPSDILGIKGQYCDILRKTMKLKKPMWDGGDLVGEGVIEILQDLMAHCAMAIERIQRDGAV